MIFHISVYGASDENTCTHRHLECNVHASTHVHFFCMTNAPIRYAGSNSVCKARLFVVFSWFLFRFIVVQNFESLRFEVSQRSGGIRVESSCFGRYVVSLRGCASEVLIECDIRLCLDCVCVLKMVRILKMKNDKIVS